MTQKLTLWDEKYQQMIQNFNHPLGDLKSHVTSFESIFDLYAKKELLEQELATKEERLKDFPGFKTLVTLLLFQGEEIFQDLIFW